MNRTNTRGQQNLLVFNHHDSWMQCPVHALATMLVTNASPDTKLFPHVTSVVGYMNSLLKTLSVEANTKDAIPVQVTKSGVSRLAGKELTEYLRTHSFRSGGSTIASSHRDIQVHWIVPRGNWTLDTIQTVFRYLNATMKNDSRVGRALAGWPDIDGGGIAPSMDAIPTDDHMEFRLYVEELLGMTETTPALKEVLICMLLLHYEDVLHEFPESILLQKMHSTQVSLNKVKSWSECVRKRYEQQNCLYLPTNDLNEAIAPSSVHDFMQNSLSATQSLTTQVAELQNIVTVQGKRAPLIG